jgi:DNA-binding LacI/PurR family transcriptional regulator
VVEVDRISGAKGVLSVLSDNGGGARLAAEHLLKLGHRSFAVIAGDTQVTSNQERLEGFRQGLKTRGIALEDSRVALCPNTPEGGYRSARRLLGSKPPSALFVLNAQMMAGAMQAIKELGFKIPGDISVVSFDDTQWSSRVDPPHTVVAQQTYGLGCTAASLILESIEGHQTTPGAKQVRLSTHLIERQSCNAARTDIAAK